MVQNAQVARNDLVLKDRSSRYVNLVSVIGDDDDGASKRHSFAKSDISRYCQVVKLQDVWYRSKPLQKLFDLYRELKRFL